jgi:hypothetical protein
LLPSSAYSLRASRAYCCSLQIDKSSKADDNKQRVTHGRGVGSCSVQRSNQKEPGSQQGHTCSPDTFVK